MLEIRVTVDLPGIPEAINHLAEALRFEPVVTCGELEGATPENDPIPVAAEPAADSELTPVATEPVAEPEPTPAAEAAADPEPIPVAAEPAPAPAPVKRYTFRQISKAGAELCADAGMMEKLRALLQSKYHVSAITVISEDQYNELAADLIAMGATIEEE